MGIAEDILKRLGVGLSRLLRYSFGGFLAVVIAAKVNPAGAAELLKALSWELAALACVVVGAGIYAVHRSLVIPVHHWIGCFLFWLWDRRTPAEMSLSPTRWFSSSSLGVVCDIGVCLPTTCFGRIRTSSTKRSANEPTLPVIV